MPELSQMLDVSFNYWANPVSLEELVFDMDREVAISVNPMEFRMNITMDGRIMLV